MRPARSLLRRWGVGLALPRCRNGPPATLELLHSRQGGHSSTIGCCQILSLPGKSFIDVASPPSALSSSDFEGVKQYSCGIYLGPGLILRCYRCSPPRSPSNACQTSRKNFTPIATVFSANSRTQEMPHSDTSSRFAYKRESRFLLPSPHDKRTGSRSGGNRSCHATRRHHQGQVAQARHGVLRHCCACVCQSFRPVTGLSECRLMW